MTSRSAAHLFEEPRALDEVARDTAAWFLEHFTLGPEWPSTRIGGTRGGASARS
jgi:hypothetical protein